jgi:hypothetical protein
MSRTLHSPPLKTEASLSRRGLKISDALLCRAGEVGIGLPSVVALGVALPLDEVVRDVATSYSAGFLGQDLFYFIFLRVELGKRAIELGASRKLLVCFVVRS